MPSSFLCNPLLYHCPQLRNKQKKLSDIKVQRGNYIDSKYLQINSKQFSSENV